MNTFERSPNSHNLRQLKRLKRDPGAVLKVTLLVEKKKIVGFKYDAVKP